MVYRSDKSFAKLVGALLVLAMALALVGAGIYGYVCNFISILHAGPIGTWGGMMLGRILGVFVPFVGAILGFF